MEQVVMDVLSFAVPAFIIAGLVFAANEYNRTSWACWFAFSLTAPIVVLGIVAQPQDVIAMYGRQVVNLALLYVLLCAEVVFIACIVIASVWVWERRRRNKAGKFSAEARAAADAFFKHKRKHPKPTPYERLTPLQKRMQSGGA